MNPTEDTPTGRMRRVEFDPNIRANGNNTYVAGADIPGVVVGLHPSGVEAGDRLVLVESEEGIEVDGVVSGFSNTREIVYVDVDWTSLRARQSGTDVGEDTAIDLAEVLAEAVHAAWVDAKRAKGCTSHMSEAGEELMVPYCEMSEPAKDLDRVTVRAVLETIAATGRTVVRTDVGAAGEGYKEFVAEEHLTTPVTLVRAAQVIEEAEPEPIVRGSEEWHKFDHRDQGDDWEDCRSCRHLRLDAAGESAGESGTDEDVYLIAATAHYADIVEPPYVGLGVQRGTLAASARFRRAVDAALEYERTRTAVEIAAKEHNRAEWQRVAEKGMGDLFRTVDGLRAELAEARAEIETADRIRVECQHDRDQHAVLLGEILGYFTDRRHPGRPCLRTAWIDESTIAEWHERLAATTAGDWRTDRARLLAENADMRRKLAVDGG